MTEFRETQVFCTASYESPEYVNVSVTIQAVSLEEAKARAQVVPCQLEVNENGFTLIRAGERHNLTAADISFEDTGNAARERLRQHGSPISVDDPELQDKAVAGLLDGTLVVTEDELVSVPLDPEWLTCPHFRQRIHKADHLAYSVVALDEHPS